MIQFLVLVQVQVLGLGLVQVQEEQDDPPYRYPSSHATWSSLPKLDQVFGNFVKFPGLEQVSYKFVKSGEP